jgi:hypothetical protein
MSGRWQAGLAQTRGSMAAGNVTCTRTIPPENSTLRVRAAGGEGGSAHPLVLKPMALGAHHPDGLRAIVGQRSEVMKHEAPAPSASLAAATGSGDELRPLSLQSSAAKDATAVSVLLASGPRPRSVAAASATADGNGRAPGLGTHAWSSRHRGEDRHERCRRHHPRVHLFIVERGHLGHEDVHLSAASWKYAPSRVLHHPSPPAPSHLPRPILDRGAPALTYSPHPVSDAPPGSAAEHP